MTVAAHSHTSNARAADPVLADLVEQFLQRLQAGEALDPTGFAAAHPEHAEPLRQLLPALDMMAALSHSAGRHGTGVPPAEDIAGPGIGVLGDFHILREVGRGGMGVVYEADQLSLRRRVALKVLPFAAALDPRQLQRFKSEAQATGQLHHTNIVPVHAVGAERGVHYYAMQFIDGRTLADVIRELRQLEGKEQTENEGRGTTTGFGHCSPSPQGGEGARRAGEGESLESRLQAVCAPAAAGTPTPAGRGSPDPALGSTEGLPAPVAPSSSSTRNRAYFRNVARLGIEAAEALEHAHQDGIIHRDIKPANLMVDAKGHLWVTDFGLARLKSDGGLTITGDLLGTLRYMSPESAAGGSGRAAVDGRTDIYSLGVTLYELLTLEPAFDCPDRQELLRRVVEEEPRPPRQRSASIPRDLETILLKAIAKEPDGRYQTAQDLADDLRRFLDHKPVRAKRPSLVERAAKWARRHRMVVAAAFLFLLLAVLTLATSTVLVARERREAARQRDEARKAVDEMYTEVAEQWLAEKAALEPVQRALLQKALDYYQRFAGEENSDPKVRLKMAMAYRRVGNIQRILGTFSEAETAYRRALAIIEKLAAHSPSAPQYQSELAASLDSLGGLLLFETGHHAEAESLIRRAIALLEKLAADSPSEPRYRSQWARSHHNLGALLQSAGRLGDAEQEYRRANALYEKLVADFPAVPDYRLSLARPHADLGVLLWRTDRRGQAEQEYRRASALFEKLVADFPAVPLYRDSLAVVLSNLSALLESALRWTEAEPAARRATELLSKLVADSPAVPDYRSHLALSHITLGNVLDNTHHHAEAEHNYRQSIALHEKLASESPSVPRYRLYLGWSHKSLGLLLSHSGRPGEAEQEYHQAIALNEKLVADFPDVAEHQEQLASSIIDLADLLEAAGRRTEAEPSYRRVIALQEKRTDANSQNALAWMLVTNPNPRLRDPRRALRAAKKAVEQYDQAGRYWGTLGVAHYRVGDWGAAIEALEKSMHLDAGGDAAVWFFLAMAHWQQGDKSKARSWYEKALQWMEKNKSQDEELRRFRAEAAALLGVTDHPTPTAGKKEEKTPRQSKP